MQTKICPGCHIEKDIAAFNYKSKVNGRRQGRCRDCTRLQLQRHYQENTAYYITKAKVRNRAVRLEQRARLISYLSTHPCVDCGEADMVCLEFDHVRGQKIKDVASMLGDYTWTTIEAEIAKCEVRCANCHRRKTAKQFGYWAVEE